MLKEKYYKALNKVMSKYYSQRGFHIGGYQEESICIEQEDDGWVVYNGERGNRMREIKCDTLLLACLEVFRKVTNRIEDLFLMENELLNFYTNYWEDQEDTSWTTDQYLKALKDTLERRYDESSYQIGFFQNGATCIQYQKDGWVVYKGENGNCLDEKWYNTVLMGCLQFIRRLTDKVEEISEMEEQISFNLNGYNRGFCLMDDREIGCIPPKMSPEEEEELNRSIDKHLKEVLPHIFGE